MPLPVSSHGKSVGVPVGAVKDNARREAARHPCRRCVALWTGTGMDGLRRPVVSVTCDKGCADSTGFLRNKNAALPARAQKSPLTLSGLKKTWVPAGASGHELSRLKRVSWLPAYGRMSAMRIPVACVGVKTHVFMERFSGKIPNY